MVSWFSRVDGLPQTHNLVRHGDPKDRFCFHPTSRMSLLVVFVLWSAKQQRSSSCADCTCSNCSSTKWILSSIHGGLLTEPNVIVTWQIPPWTFPEHPTTILTDIGFHSRFPINCLLRFEQDCQCTLQKLSRRKSMVAEKELQKMSESQVARLRERTDTEMEKVELGRHSWRTWIARRFGKKRNVWNCGMESTRVSRPFLNLSSICGYGFDVVTILSLSLIVQGLRQRPSPCQNVTTSL